MCGVAGFCDFNKKSSIDVLKNMTDVLLHRGPDSSGYKVFMDPGAHIGLGHRRLSILDLSPKANQPMADKRQDYTIVLNGEIYNFSEIKKVLEDDGFVFDSKSDTEVVLKSFIRWGVDAVDKFIGMFSFVIYDKRLRKLYLFRDRAGVKPLYYHYNNGVFLFSSELKSFHKAPQFIKEIDQDALSLFFQFGYVPTPKTIFNNTFKLRPGHYLELDISSAKLSEVKYWDVIDYYNRPRLDISESEATNELEKILESAFRYRMIADVPVGVFLSGGYDSSAVAAILQSNSSARLKTFTIGFHESKYNEANEAKAIADYLGTDHTEYYCTTKEAQEMLEQLPGVYDEPFVDTSAIPTMLVSKLARQQVTVALSADGGDEAFAGYNHTENYVNRLRKNQRIPRFFRDIAGNEAKLVTDATKRYKGFNRYGIALINRLWKHRELYSADGLLPIITRPRCPNYKMYRLFRPYSDSNMDSTLFANFGLLSENVSDLDKCLSTDYQTYMTDDILTKVDRATMSFSLEGREPLLDHRIIEFAARLPSAYKYDNGTKKKILKNIVHRHIPKKLMDRPKKGFSVPVERWLRHELSEYLDIYLNKKELEKHGFFNYEYVCRLKKWYVETGNDYSMVWSLLVFQMWFNEWMD